jgi:ParB family chromosome partitioning protein
MAAALARAGGQIGGQKTKNQTETGAPSHDPDMRRLTQEIADLIGLNAEFKFKGKGGELKIRFSQFDELDSLLRKLGVGVD